MKRMLQLFQVWFQHQGEKTNLQCTVHNMTWTKWKVFGLPPGHPKARLFVTHGGQNSLLQAVYHGVPVMAMPLFGDQFDNVVRAEARGLGLSLRPAHVTRERVGAAVQTLTQHDRWSPREPRAVGGVGCTEAGVNQWKHGRVEGLRMDEWNMDGWMDEWMNALHRRMEGLWMNCEWWIAIDKWMDWSMGLLWWWVDRWMEGFWNDW